jgi:thiol-disulfide isomerase/thioredoxin
MSQLNIQHKSSYLIGAAALVVAALMIMPSNTVHSESYGKSSDDGPKLIAVKFHADWCGSCKAMGPILTDLTNKFDGTPVLFLEFDLTNQSSKNQAKLHAAALGLDRLWKENSGSTGKIYLVDPASKQSVAKLDKTHTIKDMSAKIKEAL